METTTTTSVSNTNSVMTTAAGAEGPRINERRYGAPCCSDLAVSTERDLQNPITKMVWEFRQLSGRPHPMADLRELLIQTAWTLGDGRRAF
jgi:hypothetical protein